MDKWFNPSAPGHNGRHFGDDIFQRILLNQNFEFRLNVNNSNNPALV